MSTTIEILNLIATWINALANVAIALVAFTKFGDALARWYCHLIIRIRPSKLRDPKWMIKHQKYM